MLHSATKEVKENLGLEAMTVTADKGYKIDEIKKCHDDKIETVVCIPQNNKNTKVFHKSEFTYDEEKDHYICPAGKVLTLSETDKKKNTKEYSCKSCKNCSQKNKCTTSKTGRRVHHHIERKSEQRNAKMLAQNREMYKKRGQICEHPFGTVKRTMGYTQFLTRGKSKVTAETALIYTCYNLKRLRTINATAPKAVA